MAERRAPFVDRLVENLEALRTQHRRSPTSFYTRRPVTVGMTFTRGLLTFRSPEGSTCRIAIDPEAADLDVRSVEDVRWAWNGDVLGAGLDLLAKRLSDPSSPDRAAILAWAETPPWQRALEEFEGRVTTDRDAAPKDRLVFDVALGRPPSITVRIQEPRKHGKWTPGRKLEFWDPPPVGIDPEDRRAFADARAAVDLGRLGSFLDRVALHPRITVDGSKDSYRPRRVVPSLEVRAAEGGFTLALGLGPATLALEDAADLLTSADEVLHAHGGELLYADMPSALATLVTTAGGAVFPIEAISRILQRLSAATPLDVRLPDDLAARRAPGIPTPLVLLLAAPGGAVELRVAIEPHAGGPRFEPGAGPRDVLLEDAEGPFSSARDLAEEVTLARALVESLPEATEEHGAFVRVYDREASPAVLITLAEREGLRVEWRGDATLQLLGAATRSALKLKVTERRDWLGLDGGVEVGGEVVSLAALLEAVRERRKWVRVGKDKLVRLADDLAEALATASDVVHAGKSGLEVSRFAAGVLAKTVERDAQLEGAQAFRTMMAKIGKAERSTPKVPDELRAELRAYQEAGFAWLARLAAWGGGGILADEMGLGKTVQALALLTLRASEGPQLVVAPMSVAPNWRREAERFAPGLRVKLHHGASRALKDLGPGVVVVTTYDVLTRDKDALAKVHFATAIFDEAQSVKNAASLRAKAAGMLVADVRFGLTGTPIENHLGELWSLFRVILPGLLGSWESFRARFAIPIERDKDPARRKALADVVRPFLLRRTKAEVATELPARTEVDELVALTPEEREVYDAIRVAAVESLGSGEDGDGRFKMLAAITRLRLAACHPKLVDPRTKIPSSKLGLLVDIIRELREGGHKALVFSQFVQHLRLAEAALGADGVRMQYLDGSTPSRDRERAVEAFQAGEGDVFLISLRAGGTGLNLTAADYVIHLDPWWNPAVEDQATDRAHRIGQTKPVTVIRLVSEGTIEESVLKLHAEKRALADALLEGTDQAGVLGEAELAALIRGV